MIPRHGNDLHFVIWNCNWPARLGDAVGGRKEEVEKGRRRRKTIIIKWERSEEGWGGGAGEAGRRNNNYSRWRLHRSKRNLDGAKGEEGGVRGRGFHAVSLSAPPPCLHPSSPALDHPRTELRLLGELMTVPRTKKHVESIRRFRFSSKEPATLSAVSSFYLGTNGGDADPPLPTRCILFSRHRKFPPKRR